MNYGGVSSAFKVKYNVYDKVDELHNVDLIYDLNV